MKVKLINENFKTDWVDNLLLSRGIIPENLQKVKHPTRDNLNDYHLLDNIEVAATRILQAIAEKQKIGLLFDCDVDGLTSSTIMYKYLKEIDPECNIVYTFHEHKQHGLEDSYWFFINEEVNLIIELDAGINDKPYHDILKEFKIDVVCGDHHEYEGNGYSDNCIYVDNQICDYPNKSLAGCGISWQICRMMDELNGTDYAFKYIDLVALGCAADVMSSIEPENRFIYDYGFSHIEDKTFSALCDKQAYSMNNIVDYTSVAFYIAPLINACMRTGTIEDKMMLYEGFLHPDEMIISQKRGAKGEMTRRVNELCRILTNVKSRQDKLIKKYEEMFRDRLSSLGMDENNIIVVHLEPEDDFESELNGLIAMRLSSYYHKPCIVVRDGLDDLTKGSMRNPGDCPIPELKPFLYTCPYVEWVMGHNNSAGVAIETPHIEDFITWFNNMTEDLNFNDSSYQVNFELNAQDGYLSDLCWDLVNHNYLWGAANPQPLILLHDVKIAPEQITIMGKSKDTLKFFLNGVNCIKFKSAKLAEDLSKIDMPITITLVGKAALNEFNGTRSVQLIIENLEWEYEDILEF